MKLKHIGTGLLVITILSCVTATAQKRNPQVSLRASAYDVKREATLTGTVLNFSENSLVAPAGAHLSLQTAEGTVDVHLGPGLILGKTIFQLRPATLSQFLVHQYQSKQKLFFLLARSRAAANLLQYGPRGDSCWRGTLPAKIFKLAERTGCER